MASVTSISKGQINTFSVEFREKGDRYNLRVNPAVSTEQKYKLIEIINTIDDDLFTIRCAYVMKTAYSELTTLLDENGFSYITILDDA